METTTYIINSQKVISETLDGETIIINLENGNYFSMNAGGTAIWDAINKKQSINISDKNIKEFIELLQKENLIHEVENSDNTISENQDKFLNPKIEKYEDMQEMLLADPVHDVDTMGWPKLKKEK